MEQKQEEFSISIASVVKYIKSLVTDKDKFLSFMKGLTTYLLIYGAFLLFMNALNITPEKVRELFAGKGLLLVPLFIAVQLLASLTPLPDVPFIAAGVLFFEPWATFILIWIGMWLGSVANFFIARRLGRNIVQKRYPQTSKWIDRFAGKYGFETIVVARAFTLVTFDLIAYAAGISNISAKKFAFASVFGIIPVALNATLVGLALTSQDILQAIALFVFSGSLAVMLGWIAQRYNKWIEHKAVKNNR